MTQTIGRARFRPKADIGEVSLQDSAVLVTGGIGEFNLKWYVPAIP